MAGGFGGAGMGNGDDSQQGANAKAEASMGSIIGKLREEPKAPACLPTGELEKQTKSDAPKIYCSKAFQADPRRSDSRIRGAACRMASANSKKAAGHENETKQEDSAALYCSPISGSVLYAPRSSLT